jgi:hypothetical protein
LGNDAQALPGASRPLHVSSLALFALQYIPLGVFLFKGKLTCYQSTLTELTQALVSVVVEKNKDSLSKEILGKGAGTRVVLDFLLSHFEDLKRHQARLSLPENSELLLWLFSNSGTGADCAIERVPERALRFASLAASLDYTHHLRKLMEHDAKDPRFQLFECIRGGRDCEGLYPAKNWPGVPAEFYDFYQEHVRGINAAAMPIAEKLAGIVITVASDKEKKEIRKREFVRSSAGRNRVRKAIIENLSVAEYDTLFPSKHHPVRKRPMNPSFKVVR